MPGCALDASLYQAPHPQAVDPALIVAETTGLSPYDYRLQGSPAVWGEFPTVIARTDEYMVPFDSQGFEQGRMKLPKWPAPKLFPVGGRVPPPPPSSRVRVPSDDINAWTDTLTGVVTTGATQPASFFPPPAAHEEIPAVDASLAARLEEQIIIEEEEEEWRAPPPPPPPPRQARPDRLRDIVWMMPPPPAVQESPAPPVAVESRALAEVRVDDSPPPSPEDKSPAPPVEEAPARTTTTTTSCSPPWTNWLLIGLVALLLVLFVIGLGFVVNVSTQMTSKLAFLR